LGFIEGIPGHRATSQRRSGFEAALRDHGIEPNPALIRPGLFTLESGVEAGLDLLKLDAPPTAVVASNDESAAGVVAAAAQLGLRAPDDISVCGFDDSPIARHLTPALTTISQPTFDFGREAIAMLMSFREARSKGQATSSIRQIMHHGLVERASVHPLI
jgi:LacI family transcriptional regulator